MFQKIIIRTTIEICTGLHIGTGGAFSAIGAVDSPVVKDPRTNLPIIPGSSLKGKMRFLLSKSLSNGEAPESRNSDSDGKATKSHNNDEPKILRLFGSSNPIKRSRLQFSDAYIKDWKEEEDKIYTEVKFENTIDRGTCIANPRQIERVVSGSEFEAVITYDWEGDIEILEDMENLAKAMKLLQFDYLGGHGTRGSGRVSFKEIKFEDPDDPKKDIDIGDYLKKQFKEMDDDLEKRFKDIAKQFEEVKKYELLQF